MLSKHLLSLICIVFCTTTSIFSQVNSTVTTPKLSLTKSTISNQFDYITKKSSNWRDDKKQNYEVVKAQWIDQLKSNTLDTLKVITDKHSASLTTISKQEQEIKTLQVKLNNTQTDLDIVTSKKDEISLFGMSLSKTSYNTILFFVIIILIGLLAFFVYQFKNSNVLTKEAKYQLTEVENEFNEHRRNALEREQKVRRELQDLINKNRGK
mgnify:CR=1 FL=1